METVAGGGKQGHKDGPSKSAQFYAPIGLCKSKAGEIFVVDGGNNRVRRISPRGDVETLAGEQSFPLPLLFHLLPNFIWEIFFINPRTIII